MREGGSAQDQMQALQLGLMESALEASKTPQELPESKVAGLSPLQTGVLDTAQGMMGRPEGIMSFRPYFDQAEGLYQASAGLDPTKIQQAMDPYLEQVVERAQDDVFQQRKRQQAALNEAAIRSGAFGGGRADIQSAMADTEALKIAGDIGASLRSAGYQQALKNLGQAGQGIAGLGQAVPGLELSTLSGYYGLGSGDQAFQQAVLDTQKQNQLAQMYEPYTRLGFLSDIYSKVPSGSSPLQTGANPFQPSPMQQLFGYGIAGLSAAAGAKQLGLFG